MGILGLQGVVRGRPCRTSISSYADDQPADRVQWQFNTTHSNHLWVVDFTFVTMWAGYVYDAFVIDVFTLRIVGWWVPNSRRAELVLVALEQSLWSRTETQGLCSRL